ncbi:MAG TPA: family 10 glycosylhydrolase [Sedimentisphaerales bacterium]|nr:family 10 glycosylhydrolase [Sedimentisphaerales bacterium]
MPREGNCDMRRLLGWAMLLSIGLSAAAGGASGPELRGIWMHATQIKTPGEADALVARIDKANLNAVFLLVWYWGGQAFFESELCPMGDGVQAGYDPLGHMVKQCHQRGIQVHAWFVNGAYGAAQPRHVLDKHPDWAVDEGAGGSLWYDFGKPEVRRFQSDLMIECLKKYDLDGLHFDYIRYGPKQCYCGHCQNEFAKRYGFEPMTGTRRTTFPAVVAGMSANLLASPTTAAVLAEFSDGSAAIALNKLGAGSVLLLNWHAENEMPPAVSETVRLTLGVWTTGGGKVYLVTTAATKAEYGTSSLDAARTTLTRLGHRPATIDAERIAKLPAGSVLVLPAAYVIEEKVAKDIEAFVKRGGQVLMLDGPVKSMHLPALRRITGFAKAGHYVHRDEVIRSTGRSPLVPRGEHQIDLRKEKARAQKWAEFRKQGVTDLVKDVYRRAKAVKPKAHVTAAVFSSVESAQKAYQDWPRWLREGTIDYVVPMAYAADTRVLSREIAQWKRIDPHLARIIPGLSIYDTQDGRTVTRDVDLICEQHRLCERQGAHGNVYFSLQYLSTDVVNLFNNEFYRKDVPAYVPPLRPSR